MDQSATDAAPVERVYHRMVCGPTCPTVVTIYDLGRGPDGPRITMQHGPNPEHRKTFTTCNHWHQDIGEQCEFATQAVEWLARVHAHEQAQAGE